MAPYQQRIAVRHPDHAQEVAVDGSRGIRAVAARRWGYVNLVLVVWIAVARIPVRHAGSVRRKYAKAFKFFAFCQLSNLASLDAEHLQRCQVAVALVRMLLSGEH